MPSKNDAQFNLDNWQFVDDIKSLDQAIIELSSGEGPYGVDVERASGFRYFAKAHLIQIYREGAPAYLFDPNALSDLSELYAVMKDEEWILHAANSDLESLAEVGLKPQTLFDTELASRLLGLERVSLGAIVQELLGIELEKAYSRADWSTRPLPAEWLEYAAHDVLLLPALKNSIYTLLQEQKKLEYAKQEFAYLLNSPLKPKREMPWKKLSGFGKLKDPRAKAVARELWLSRDALARELDLAPHKVLPDLSIVAAAKALPRSLRELSKNREFRGSFSQTEIERWWLAVLKAKIVDTTLPEKPSALIFPNNVRSWEAKKPEAFSRINELKSRVQSAAAELNMPAENLLAPATIKEISWDPPPELQPQSIATRLKELGARDWQTELTTQLIAESFVEKE